MAGVIECASCGTSFPAGTRFCSECGATLTGALVRQATGMLPANQLLQDRYLILKKLAQGGQSAVYLVADTLNQSAQYAMKEMSESELTPAERTQALADFQREADMLRLLNHPALAKVHASFVEDGKHYMVMEYVEGRNLEVTLEETGKPLPESQVVNWGTALAEVLAYLHSQQPPIIYRDLKPSNIILQPDGKVKLIDFGIARFHQTGQSKDTVCLGTDGYAPIEQYSGKTEPRSDIYALGATLYHLLTNKVAVAAPTRIANVDSFVAPRQVNPDISKGMEAVILRAMEVHPTQRYDDAEEMLAALESVAAGVPIPRRTNTLPAQRQTSPSGTISGTIPTMLPQPIRTDVAVRVSPKQDTVTLALPPSLAPLANRPVLRVNPQRTISFGLVDAGHPYRREFVIENEGSEPLEATITSDHPAVLLDVDSAHGNRVHVTAWLKPFALAARHYESTIDIISNAGSQSLDVYFTVARPNASSGRDLVPVQNRQVGRPYYGGPRRAIGMGFGLFWLIGWLLIEILGHLHGAGPFPH
jgi:serine/threonine protein kinase